MDVAALAAALPAGAVLTDPEVLSQHGSDWWPLGWLRQTRGEPPSLPGAVVRPSSAADVCHTLEWAHATRTPVVPRGGGSGVSGGAATRGGEIVIDMSALASIIRIDEESRTAVVQAGVRGDVLEDELRATGLTLGHYPQSLAMSTVGGWIATSGIGHASFGFGAIERRVLGLRVALADGRLLDLREVPRSATGPDLRRLFLGSEGTLGVIIEASLSLSAAPGPYRWSAFLVPTFRQAITICRAIAQSGLPATVVRAYDERDAALSLGVAEEPPESAIIVAVDSHLSTADLAVEAVTALIADHGGRPTNPDLGEHWEEHHRDAIDTFRAVMGPERAWGRGVVVDTLEVAALWERLPDLYRSIRAVLVDPAEVVACHISHLSPSGASLYFTLLLRTPDDLHAEEVYLALWSEAVAACHGAGGTMSHHHGVGQMKTAFMQDEHGTVGLEVLRAIKQALDPHAILNPGTLLPP